ncbi:MAG: rRNA pseudouridine synthase [Lactobacillales bacterium]|nr:rRNA pseudouridine synthase [Lactobacillales bacterium]
MRLDKYLAEVGLGSRKEVKALLKKGQIAVDGIPIKDGKQQINELQATVTYFEELLHYQKFYYYLLNKPQNVISATEDKWDRTVIDLLSEEDYRQDLFPVGRLDKDTEGLLLLTNDGELAHELLSPKKHVEKEYYAKIAGIVTTDDIEKFAQGFALRSGELVRPGELTILSTNAEDETSEISLVIHEGKFHQVKRMFEAVDKKVTFLKRIRMGTLKLDKNLPLGSYRMVTEEEIESLKKG